MTLTKYFSLLIGFLTIYFPYAQAQNALTGPVCVTSDVEYQYNVNGIWDSTSRVEICVTGGVIMGENKTCFSGRPLSFVRVRWNANIRSGKLVIKSAAGTAALNVSVTTLLKEGKMDPTSTFQVINFNSIPGTIVCAKATGGSCSPIYSYKWEQSSDGVSWKEIANATTADLKLGIALKSSMYYRRQVTETVSKRQAYSDIATIMVQRPTRSN